MSAANESKRRRWYRARTKTALGDALKGVRQRAGDTQAEAAAKANSSRPHLSRLERGSTPQLDVLMYYLDEYGYEILLVPRGSVATVALPPAGP